MSEIGHNAPPVEQHALHINDLYDEAHNWLDGAPIENAEQADALGALLAKFREARSGADAQRVSEKKPHDDAAKAVQTAWKPLIDKCERAEKIAKNALGAWQLKLEAEQRAEAARLAREAEAARIAAEEAARIARTTDRLDEAEGAEDALRAAKTAEQAATRADKAKPLVGTGGGRSIGLRSYWIAELTDAAAALRHYREKDPDALKAWLVEQAQRDVNAGSRAIPGIKIREDRRAA